MKGRKASLLNRSATLGSEALREPSASLIEPELVTIAEAKRLAEALRGAAQHPELVLLHVMSRVDGVDSISIKDERQRSH